MEDVSKNFAQKLARDALITALLTIEWLELGINESIKLGVV